MKKTDKNDVESGNPDEGVDKNKVNMIACGKCLGILYSITDSKGYKKQVPKCVG